MFYEQLRKPPQNKKDPDYYRIVARKHRIGRKIPLNGRDFFSEYATLKALLQMQEN